jgi:hypothetical protein
VLRRWDTGLNKKRLAYFYFSRDDTEYKLMPGDELKLRHRAPCNRGLWEGVGHVTLVRHAAWRASPSRGHCAAQPRSAAWRKLAQLACLPAASQPALCMPVQLVPDNPPQDGRLGSTYDTQQPVACS